MSIVFSVRRVEDNRIVPLFASDTTQLVWTCVLDTVVNITSHVRCDKHQTPVIAFVLFHLAWIAHENFLDRSALTCQARQAITSGSGMSLFHASQLLCLDEPCETDRHGAMSMALA